MGTFDINVTSMGGSDGLIKAFSPFLLDMLVSPMVIKSETSKNLDMNQVPSNKKILYVVLRSPTFCGSIIG